MPQTENNVKNIENDNSLIIITRNPLKIWLQRVRDHQKYQTQPMQSVTNPENPLETRRRYHGPYNEGHKDTKSEPFPVWASRGVPAHVKTCQFEQRIPALERQVYIHRKIKIKHLHTYIYIDKYVYTHIHMHKYTSKSHTNRNSNRNAHWGPQEVNTSGVSAPYFYPCTCAGAIGATEDSYPLYTRCCTN